jgi:prepilin-type N-terminal cleavage/methylation domain-containing protein
MGRVNDGFSLIEMLIVLAVIATLSAMILPNFLSAKASANESAVVATLRAISTAQHTFKTRAIVDRDFDGDGEYGYLGEMAGVVPPRGGAADPIRPVILGASFRVIQEGSVNRTGYMFRVALPREDGAPAEEAPDGGEDPANPCSHDIAESAWVCYAWPKIFGATGARVFVVNEAGDILSSNNEGDQQRYSGLAHPPPSDAAYTVDGRITVPLAVNAVANDEGLWTSLR